MSTKILSGLVLFVQRACLIYFSYEALHRRCSVAIQPIFSLRVFERRDDPECYLSLLSVSRSAVQLKLPLCYPTLGGPPPLESMSETGLISCLLSILFLLFIALTERKVFAYVMRRVGPVVMGRNGAFQIAADLVKFLSKEVFFIPRPTTSLAPVFLALM